MTQTRALGTRTDWGRSAPSARAIRVPSAPSSASSASPARSGRAALRGLRDRLASAGLHRPRMLRGPRTEQPFDAPRLQTARLELRAHRIDDADDWFALQSQPAVTRFLPWPERDRARSRQHLRDRTRHTRLWQADDFLALAVVLDGHVIGDVSLHLRSVAAPSRAVEVGWVIHPDRAGQGYATEAATALLAFAFTVVGAREAIAVTDARNVASVALARRLGFEEQEGPRHGHPESVLTLRAG